MFGTIDVMLRTGGGRFQPIVVTRMTPGVGKERFYAKVGSVKLDAGTLDELLDLIEAQPNVEAAYEV